MNYSNPQVPHGYYYAPQVQGGKYQTAFSQFGEVAGELVTSYVAFQFGGEPQRATYTGMGTIGNLVSSLSASLFGEVGQLIDNIPTDLQNLATMFSELNDRHTWMAPDFAD